MDLITLDTNALRDWAWSEDRSDENRYSGEPEKKVSLKEVFNKLRKLSKNGRCEIGVTTQIYTDYEKSVGELPDYIEDMIGPYADISISSPSISTFPMKFPFVFIDEDEIQEIFDAVFPNSKPEHRMFKKNRKDAFQLYAHRVAGRDFFITTDATINRAKETLASQWSIKIETPESYVSLFSDD